ncbi:hypothetical protein BU17DRAFT_71114 [Hysterangium stoloniferum]|nr:hypothetical protein BU17DRAFT_71114 [Hysterangium stoloniferum]
MSELGLTMGIALLGTLASAILYGTTVTQTYLYFQRFPKDGYIIKTMGVGYTPSGVHYTLHVLLSFDIAGVSILKLLLMYASISSQESLGLKVPNRELSFLRPSIFTLEPKNSDRLGLDNCDLHIGLHPFRIWSLSELKYFVKFKSLEWVAKLGLGCWFLYNSKTGYRNVCCAFVLITFAILPDKLVYVAIFWILGKWSHIMEGTTFLTKLL